MTPREAARLRAAGALLKAWLATEGGRPAALPPRAAQPTDKGLVGTTRGRSPQWDRGEGADLIPSGPIGVIAELGVWRGWGRVEAER